MSIQVVSELCSCCGNCVEACPVGAIRLEGQQAKIEDGLCTQCEACVGACPNGAIVSTSMPVLHSSAAVLATTQAGRMPDTANTTVFDSTHSNRSLAPVAGAVLAFLGSDVAPRLVDLLVTTLERKLGRPEKAKINSFSDSLPSMTRRCVGSRRQIRYRRGRTVNKNIIERR